MSGKGQEYQVHVDALTRMTEEAENIQKKVSAEIRSKKTSRVEMVFLISGAIGFLVYPFIGDSELRALLPPVVFFGLVFYLIGVLAWVMFIKESVTERKIRRQLLRDHPEEYAILYSKRR